MISQTSRKALHQGGKVRLIGDETARKLERGMYKNKGWLDVDHGSGLSERDQETIGALGALTTDQRSLIDAQISEFARLNRARGEEDTPKVAGPDRPH